MEPEDTTPEPDMGNSNQEPNTPEHKARTYSSLGSGDITSPLGRILRPPSAASNRRPSTYGPGSRRSSSGYTSLQDSEHEDWSLAGRSARSPSPGRMLERIGDQDEEVEGGESGRRLLVTLGARVERSDLQDNQDGNMNSQGEDEKGDKKETADETLHIKNEKLRIKNEKLRIKNEKLRIKNEKLRIENQKFRDENKEHVKQIKHLEGSCEDQESQIKQLRGARKADQKAAEIRQQDFTELQKSKEDLEKDLVAAESQVIKLEDEIKKLEQLKKVQKDLEDAQWKLEEVFHVNEKQALKIVDLQEENKKLRSSNQDSEEKRQKIEHEHKALESEMYRVQYWMEKIYTEQLQKDKEQFRACDEQVLDLVDRRLAGANRNSVQSSAESAQEENLGDFISSRPQSQAGQSRPSSSYSVDGHSRPQSLTRGPSDPFAMPSSPLSISVTRSPVDDIDDTVPFQRKTSGQVGFANVKKDLRLGLLAPPLLKKGSNLRHSSKPAERRLSQPAAIKVEDPSSPTILGLANVGPGGRLSSRALSAPHTKQERKKLCERLKKKGYVPITWENFQDRTVFELVTEPSRGRAATWDGEQPLATDIERDDTRHRSRRPLPIFTKLESSPLESPRDQVERFSDAVKQAPSTPPSTRAFEALLKTPESTGASTSFETPPSPSIARRRKDRGEKGRGKFSTVNSQGSPIAKNGDDGKSLHNASPTTPSKSPRTKVPPSPRAASTSAASSPSFGFFSTPLSANNGEFAQPSDLGVTDDQPGELASEVSGNADMSNSSARPQSSDSQVPATESAAPATQDETHTQQSSTDSRESEESHGRAQSSPLLGDSRNQASEYTGYKLQDAVTDRLEVKGDGGQGNAADTMRSSNSKAGLEEGSEGYHRRFRVGKVAALVLGFSYFLVLSLALYTYFSAFRSPAPISSPAVVSVLAPSCPPCQASSHAQVCEPCGARTKFYTHTVTETSSVGVASPPTCPPCQLSSKVPMCEACSANSEAYTETVTVATPAWITSILTKTWISIETEIATEIQLRDITITVATPAWMISTSTVTTTMIEPRERTVTETETQEQTVTLTLSQREAPINVPRELSTITKTSTSTIQAPPITRTSTITETTTLIQKQIESHTATVTETETVTIPSSQSNPPTIDLPLLPPTKSYTGPYLPSFLSNFNNPIPSLPHPLPIPRAIPATYPAFPFTSPCECSCPTPAKPSPILTATQLDERAARARKGNMQVQQLAKGPSYMGLVPEARKWADVLEMKVHEWLLSPVWGRREY
ncbi:hypothetical protein H2200_010899 [Cladophialophora chaetospira]|uniref:Uncharacterized protein n=1 Tax=Cladophialophora chaetospira TaxID=386627 RepID=A0AA38X0Z5_9EURO|nr:hypothetical protein H2200_010899 [Cladophialophora chaetospira]